MVTKRRYKTDLKKISSVLAKILMVTKLSDLFIVSRPCSVLAKILMVTKLEKYILIIKASSVLAKILMVTKPQKYGSTFLNVIEY